MRLRDRVAMVVGGGQTAGQTIGNGRAMATLFAREGATVVVADRDLASARETVAMIEAEQGRAVVQELDVRDDGMCAAAVEACVARSGRLDVLVNNVGIGTGDGSVTRITDEAWDLIYEVNVKGALHTCRHALPVMRRQESGVILNISSIASICSAPILAYKSSKAALNALTHTLATSNAKYGIRANAILPGLMNTPMAIESISKARGVSREELIATRDAQVPLRGGMGSAWDVAHAALFLASDEARFITGVLLPVDGGQSARIG
ncbi:MAG: SDR family oxidoreductase [Myxococcales bacterium]|nr:SDR family oxidoreductase [Myxococcales bacterium]MDD9967622.1 SDR family oxidoreductase [Myxococcales bacterium]